MSSVERRDNLVRFGKGGEKVAANQELARSGQTLANTAARWLASAGTDRRGRPDRCRRRKLSSPPRWRGRARPASAIRISI